MDSKPKIVDLPEWVPMWRRHFPEGTVVVYGDDKTKPLSIERVNMLLDRAKNRLWEE